ncbi:glycoside hydrolase family 12 protein [Hyaloscypha variabilis]
MKLTQVAALPLFFSVVLAAPTKTFPLQARSTTLTGSFASVVTGAYTVYQNLWGEADATSGSQTLTLDSESDGTVVWSTSWTWAGGSDDVKSYDNIALTTTGVKISSISSIPTVYHWSYSGSSIVADVSYDLFTASSASGTNEFEIMVWLAALGGAGPISSSGSSIGSTTVGGTTFDLYSGPNGDTTVYSFVATSEAKSFSGDLLEFFTYLIDHEGFSSSQYITTLEAGTEPFTDLNSAITQPDQFNPKEGGITKIWWRKRTKTEFGVHIH